MTDAIDVLTEILDRIDDEPIHDEDSSNQYGEAVRLETCLAHIDSKVRKFLRDEGILA